MLQEAGAAEALVRASPAGRCLPPVWCTRCCLQLLPRLRRTRVCFERVCVGRVHPPSATGPHPPPRPLPPGRVPCAPSCLCVAQEELHTERLLPAVLFACYGVRAFPGFAALYAPLIARISSRQLPTEGVYVCTRADVRPSVCPSLCLQGGCMPNRFVLLPPPFSLGIVHLPPRHPARTRPLAGGVGVSVLAAHRRVQRVRAPGVHPCRHHGPPGLAGGPLRLHRPRNHHHHRGRRIPRRVHGGFGGRRRGARLPGRHRRRGGWDHAQPRGPEQSWKVSALRPVASVVCVLGGGGSGGGSGSGGGGVCVCLVVVVVVCVLGGGGGGVCLVVFVVVDVGCICVVARRALVCRRPHVTTGACLRARAPSLLPACSTSVGALLVRGRVPGWITSMGAFPLPATLSPASRSPLSYLGYGLYAAACSYPDSCVHGGSGGGAGSGDHVASLLASCAGANQSLDAGYLACVGRGLEGYEIVTPALLLPPVRVRCAASMRGLALRLQHPASGCAPGSLCVRERPTPPPGHLSRV